MDRRKFLEFLGIGTAGLVLLPHWSCARPTTPFKIDFPIKGIAPTSLDKLACADGLEYKILVKRGDKISSSDFFGDQNDYLAFMPLAGKADEAILWVNHEAVNRIWSSDFKRGQPLTKAITDQEMYLVGGSILKIKKDEAGAWQMIPNDKVNKRITAKTPMKFNWDEPIKDADSCMGMVGNCAGGITPWGTVLTCEENYQYYFGDRSSDGTFQPSSYGWEAFYPNPPEHYGWVVEVDIESGEARKHIALGRMAHECATVRELEDGRVVVYTGDDTVNEFLYKFIGDKPKSLKEGTLYAADTVNGKWLPLDYTNSELLQEHFKDQTDVLIQTRKAARLLGATPLNRPEDIEIDPLTGAVLVTTTNNYTVNDYMGSILKIEEKDNKPDALEFEASTFMAGGEEAGFACPDNLAFDSAANLWITTDMSESLMNQPPYTNFKNNGLFVVPRTGEQAGEAIQLISAPVEAELTGPMFSADGKTLFLSVQHPGSYTRDKSKPTSTWPTGEEPYSAVVCITGPLLEKLQGLS